MTASIKALSAHLVDMGLDPDDSLNWDSHKAHGVRSVRETPPGARKIFDDASEARKIRKIAEKVREGRFDPVWRFCPKADERSHAPPPPSRLSSFYRSRWHSIRNAMRDALYQQQIAAYFTDRTGIHQLKDNNVWLDGEIAGRALDSGRVEVFANSQSPMPSGRVQMIFNRDELDRRFPAHGADEKRDDTPADQDEAPSLSLPQRVERWLRDQFGTVRPEMTIDEMRVAYTAETGEKVGYSNMQRAAKAVFGPTKP
ncbi:hypothetical protein [Ruegeria hyattellae]|uniref:hypothetical protein n=1 Tax=Ruegeria hyattellae TaxID=3233337 RepID=UPI00355BC717